MADMFDYLKWRGDILFSQLPPNEVDALVFSTLSYLYFDGYASEDMIRVSVLRDVAQEMLSRPDPEGLYRVEEDLALLRAAAATERFGGVGICGYRNVLIPEEETQFAAVTFLLEDGTAFLAFRGTDNTLVGWKEDFNMTFQQGVPAQKLAGEYVREFSEARSMPLRLGGHSKGGNLAVYAAAKCGAELQGRIMEIYNHDGPGFTEYMMEDGGYLAIVPKIRTLVPQSSVFGLLLEHEETHTVIRSKQIGLMQHDPYSWEIMGKEFLRVEELTEDSRFLDRTFKTWLSGMDEGERSAFVDTLFDLLSMGGAKETFDLLRPQNIRTYLQTLGSNEELRQRLGSELLNLVESAKLALTQGDS